ncbi:MAG: hypothetical protein HY682_10885 [Chloroflexi bacterium]|nr:hypothetical protein [Chloroflexota bacterium]
MAEVGFSKVATTEAQHFDSLLPARDSLENGQLDKNQSSQLALLSDEEYARGIARLRRNIEDAARQGEDFTIVSDLRLYATIGWVKSS